MIKSIINLTLASIPKGQHGDRVFSLAKFWRAHNRMPKHDSGLFNDYLYFLKISDELYDPLRQYTSDKLHVKDFVTSVLGPGFTPTTIGVYPSINSIPFSSIEKPCVLKPSHASGGIMFFPADGTVPDAIELQELKKSLSSNPYEAAREKNYRYLQRRIIAEEMLPDGKTIKDYKVFCYDGQPKLIQVDSSRHVDHRRNIYDVLWNPLDIAYNFDLGDWEDKPKCLAGMLDAAAKLSSLFKSARVDFYVSGPSFYIGEITHCPESAHGRFESIASEKLFSQIYFGKR